jgi:SAM-dependent methyltransferase
MFGPITVLKNAYVQMLMVGDNNQGACYLDDAGQPGPIPQSTYMAGWLIAGAQHPTGDVLMIGLGSGTGAVALLDQFPSINVTVVEIDPAVVATASEHFPLLNKYQDEGRLHIVTSDASEHLVEAMQRGDHWDFACLDAYESNYELHMPDDLLGLLSLCCDALYLNVICLDDHLDYVARRLGEWGLTVHAILDTGSSGLRNFVIATEAVGRAHQFYAGNESEAASTVRANVAAMLDQHAAQTA